LNPPFIVDADGRYTLNQRICSLKTDKCDNEFLFWILNRNDYFLAFDSGTGQTNLKRLEVLDCPLALPPTKAEQTAIATALSDADNYIGSLEKLIAKKRLLKQGAMQQLLCPKEGWVVKKLGEVADVLDNLRVPLNDNQRATIKGDIPYCGANGIVDFVNEFVIDDDIILMAEDGGYFDEYKTRPIAYRMVGKCWVNNHAHILKSKSETDQGFLFYSLVHKNILDFINGGTRAKLNKGELVNIEVPFPKVKAEQTRIATILSDMDAGIAALEKQLAKARSIKQGMMQQLLTGKIRLNYDL
jgi:type I restriction enzyme S subunit